MIIELLLDWKSLFLSVNADESLQMQENKGGIV